ncbi:MAG: alanine--tRNA ligase [Dongiaceae bacterium]
MKTVNQTRQTFLDFFAKQGHSVVPSSPLVPRNDPTLMFTNSGMVQFKNVFTGVETRPYTRAVTAQKCVRAGGKHNDLENVGYTARHHTFFEMMGNFSFGDYFKDVAIDLAWKLITKEFALDKKRLLVTVYSEDEEAAKLWKKIAGFSDDKIIRIPTSDNFWSMGDTGPCGPCTEIFYDHGDKYAGGPPGSADADGDRFIEIWNLVFMQYEQVSKDKRVNLPKPSVDTGLGLERTAAALQGVNANYDTDVFKNLIAAAEQLTKVKAEGANMPSHRVIADHLRSSSFLIADGVLPSNEGRGYVLRRIMRRAMRHANLLGYEEPLLTQLAPALVAEMGQAYPELARGEKLIRETLKIEETKFKQTLGRGMKLLQDASAKLKSGQDLPGEVAFTLYDSYGFPLDLTQDVLRAQKRGVDMAAFNAAMEQQKAKARAAWKGSGEAWEEAVWFGLRDKVGASEFLGYSTDQADAEILAILKDGKEADSLAKGEKGILVLNQTPFYAESGGQVGDTGQITGTGGKFTVTDTNKKTGDIFAHAGSVTEGSLKVGDAVTAKIDAARRQSIKAHHSVTHLLHEALRRQLGDHVAQKGSLVAPDRLRFDISHPKPVTAEEIRAIEGAVNARIRLNDEVITRLMSTEEAMQSGARALFGEKYGDEVRVVTIGEGYSTELCGGTHVNRSGDIGAFILTGDSAVAAGVRRIEGLAGEAALKYLQGRTNLLEQLAAELHTSPEELPARFQQLIEERKKLERELSDLRRKLAGGGSGSAEAVKTIKGIRFSGKVLADIPARELKTIADDMKKQLGSGIVALIATDQGKVSIVAAVTSDLTAKISAVDLVKVAAAAVGGQGGGGRPDMAQAGGADTAKVNEALAAIENLLAAKLEAAA